MKRIDFAEYWHNLFHWKGWRSFASFCAMAWRRTASWNRWKKIFILPFSAVALLCVVCACCLFWIFTNSLEHSIFAYILYPLSAYALIVLCLKLPPAFRSGIQWLSLHSKLNGILMNKEIKFKRALYYEQFLNFSYGIFKIGSGIYYGSAWIGSDGIYNLAQAMIQLFQILRRKNAGSLEQQWRSYRICGILILLMHLTLTGIVFQMVNWNRAEELGEILVIATAAFAFVKFATSFLSIAKDRKHPHPIDSSIRMLNMAQAIFAIFSLQASMIHTFGTGESWEQLLNLITGCTVCLLIVSIGIYMIRRGNREIRKLQETEYG